MGDTGSGGGSDSTLGDKILEEGFDGVELTGDTLESVLLCLERLFEGLEMIGIDGAEITHLLFGKKLEQLLEVFAIGKNSRGGATVFLEVFDKCVFLCLHR